MSNGLECPECGGVILLDEVSGDLVCVDCGYVIEERRITLEASEKELIGNRARAGLPITKRLHDGGIGTAQPPNTRIKLDRAEERLLKRLLTELNWMASRLRLSDEVCEIAAAICRDAMKRGVITRCSRTTVAAIIYIALRTSGFTRTLYEISTIFNAPFKPLARQVRNISYGLKLTHQLNDVERMVSTLVKRMNLPAGIEERACEILRKMHSLGLTQGRKPQTVSATAIYQAAKELSIRIPMSRLTEEAGVSEPALRSLLKSYKSMTTEKT